MKRMFTVISLLILIQCLAGCGSFVDFRLSAQQFGNECLSTSKYPSEIRDAMKKAEKKYHDKTIELTGNVYVVGTYTDSTEAYVQVYSKWEKPLVKQVLVTLKDFNDVQKVKQGDLIKIIGKFEGTDNGKQVIAGNIYDRYRIFLKDGELAK